MHTGYVIIAILYLIIAASHSHFTLSGLFELDSLLYVALGVTYLGIAGVIDFGYKLE